MSSFSNLNPTLMNEEFFIIGSPNSNLEVLSLNPTSTKTKIIKMTKDKIHKLKIISDFDFTMTKMRLSTNKRGSSCHGVMEESNIFPEVYHIHSRKTLDIYYPIEIDPNMDVVTKSKYMLEWAEKSHHLILSLTDLTKTKLRHACEIAVQSPHVELRDYLQHFLILLYKYNIPLLIFSAGISNILHELLFISMRNYFEKYLSNYSKNSNFLLDKSNISSYIDAYIEDYNRFYLSHSIKLSKSQNKLGFENDEISDISISEVKIDSTDIEIVDELKQSKQSIHLHKEFSDDVKIESTHISQSNEIAIAIAKDITDKLYIISNTFLFDEENESLNGFSQPTIHVLNKKASSYLNKCSFFDSDSVKNSRFYPYNVILLGDSPGDINMTEGLNIDPDSCLKIGFLNDKVEERIDMYLKLYDIVIIGDNQGFDVPLDIITRIIHSKDD